LNFVRKLWHPSLLLIYGYLHPEVEVPRHVLVIEHCKLNLDMFVKNRGETTISVNLKGVICDQIASGMSYLHSLDVLHLDLNPSNILLSDSFLQARISDFDFMHVHKNTNFVSRAKLEYAAPEVLKGSFSKKSDVFSFGLIQIFVFTESEPLSTITGGSQNEESAKKLLAFYESKDYAVSIEDLENNLRKFGYKDDIVTKLTAKEGPILSCIAKDDKSRTDFVHFANSIAISTHIQELLFPKPLKTSVEGELFEEKRVTPKDIEKLQNDIFNPKNETMDFNVFIGKVKDHLNEGTHIDQEEDPVRKYLFLKLAKNAKLKTYYETKKIEISREKFVTFFNTHGPELLAEREKGEPLKRLSEALFCQPWYHENSNSTGSSLQKKVSKKDKKIVSSSVMEHLQNPPDMF